MSDFEKTLLSNLIYNEDFVEEEQYMVSIYFFRNRDEVTLFNIINVCC